MFHAGVCVYGAANNHNNSVLAFGLNTVLLDTKRYIDFRRENTNFTFRLSLYHAKEHNYVSLKCLLLLLLFSS